MITEKQIEIAETLLATGLVDRVFHSVEIVKDKKGEKYPAHKKGAEQFYCGPTDTKKMFAYIRQTGDAVRMDERREASAGKLYLLNTPARIVVFQDRTKEDFDALAKRFLKAAFVPGVSLVKYSYDAFKNGREESPLGNFAFDATTFYLTIDVHIKTHLFESQCEEEICKTFPNPIKCKK